MCSGTVLDAGPQLGLLPPFVFGFCSFSFTFSFSFSFFSTLLLNSTLFTLSSKLELHSGHLCRLCSTYRKLLAPTLMTRPLAHEWGTLFLGFLILRRKWCFADYSFRSFWILLHSLGLFFSFSIQSTRSLTMHMGRLD